MSQILCEYRTMQWTDDLDIQCCCNFQKSLYLCAVFAYNTDKVSSCFIVPVFFYIKGTEFAKSVCGEKNFICAVIGDHNFRPVYHWCKYESKVMISKT